MIDRDDHSVLSGYLDGELTADERAEVEALLAALIRLARRARHGPGRTRRGARPSRRANRGPGSGTTSPRPRRATADGATAVVPDDGAPMPIAARRHTSAPGAGRSLRWAAAGTAVAAGLGGACS